VNPARTSGILASRGVDGLIAGGPENVYYLSGFQGWRLLEVPPTIALAARRAEGVEVALVAPVAQLAYALQYGLRVYTYGGAELIGRDGSFKGLNQAVADAAKQRTPLPEVLKRACEDLKIWNRRVVTDADAVARALSDAWSGSDALSIAPTLFEEIRMVKTEPEIAGLREAFRLNRRAQDAARRSAELDVPWNEWRGAFARAVGEGGGEVDFFLASPVPYSGFIYPPEHVKTGVASVTYDTGLRFGHYYADNGGVWWEEKLPPPGREWQEVLRREMRRALKMVRPGVTGEEIFSTLIEGIGRHIPEYRRSHCGHGIGLSPRELPHVAAGARGQHKFEPGTIVNIEVPLQRLGHYGLQVEHTVLVTEDGYALVE
jgi:Xaa-Pro aminopeptidase